MLSNLTSLSQTAYYKQGTKDLPILGELSMRYSDERPFSGLRIACGHPLVLNSIAVAHVLAIGGAKPILCDPFPSSSTYQVAEHLQASGISILPLHQAAGTADAFLDVAAVLGKFRLPKGVAEITRSGEHFYKCQPCVTVSVDSAEIKKIECFFGTGDGMIRAWHLMRPGKSLLGMKTVQFGYGKVGRGVAHRLRKEHVQVTVVEPLDSNRDMAISEGFDAISTQEDRRLRSLIDKADVIVAATGIANAVCNSVPVELLNHSHAVLISLSAVDEFGDRIPAGRLLGGKNKPLNFHLKDPTQNRYIDPVLAGHLLALEQIVACGSDLKPGLHTLSREYDQWLLSHWRKCWPDEDYDLALSDRRST